MRQVLRHENPKEVPRDKSCGTKIQKRFQETSLAARESKRGSMSQVLRHENPKEVPRDKSCGTSIQKSFREIVLAARKCKSRAISRHAPINFKMKLTEILISDRILSTYKILDK